MKKLISLLLIAGSLACAPRQTINHEYYPWNNLAKQFQKELKYFYYLGKEKDFEKNLMLSEGELNYYYGDERRGTLKMDKRKTKLSYGLIDGRDSLVFLETPVKFNIFYVNGQDTLELDTKSKAKIYLGFRKFLGE